MSQWLKVFYLMPKNVSYGKTVNYAIRWFTRSAHKHCTNINYEISHKRYFTKTQYCSYAFNKCDKEVLNDILKLDDNPILNWAEAKENILKSSRGITGKNIDAVLIHYFTAHGFYKSGKHYAKYHNDTEQKLNIGALGKLLVMYYKSSEYEQLTEADKNDIIEIYQYITLKHPALDSTTAKNCILAISLTSKWKEGLHFLDILRNDKALSSPVSNAMIIAAFNNNEFDIGCKIFKEMINDGKTPSDNVFLAWINYCVRQFNDKKSLLRAIEDILNLISENDVLIGLDAVNELKHIFEKTFKWSVSYNEIIRNGQCSACKKNMNSIILSTEEYQLLRKTFFDKVLVGNNIFSKSSPQEINVFLAFLKKTSPYDIVVDGLNVAYSTRNKSPLVQSNILVSVVKHLLTENKNILVLGRKHMESWPKFNMNFLKENTHVFLTDNLSYDDPFLLFAALSSPNTNFISRDLMRGHKFLLSEENVRILFKRWQQSHQYFLIHLANNGTVTLAKPLPYLPSAQKNNGWHVPYRDTCNILPKDTLQLPSHWLCLQPPIKRKIKK